MLVSSRLVCMRLASGLLAPDRLSKKLGNHCGRVELSAVKYQITMLVCKALSLNQFKGFIKCTIRFFRCLLFLMPKPTFAGLSVRNVSIVRNTILNPLKLELIIVPFHQLG